MTAAIFARSPSVPDSFSIIDAITTTWYGVTPSAVALDHGRSCVRSLNSFNNVVITSVGVWPFVGKR